ncbi:unnamed protein product [Pedinophyceae sp. YPF-701]|nr:unnamed protein product [Pedinophyceae sp. YPF-701]
MQASFTARKVGPGQALRHSRASVRARVTLDRAGLDVGKMVPIGDRILVRPREAEEKSAGGIIIASTSNKEMQDTLIGDVVAVGPDVTLELKKGDVVMFSKFGGTSDLEVADGEVCFVAQTTVLAKLS